MYMFAKISLNEHIDALAEVTMRTSLMPNVTFLDISGTLITPETHLNKRKEKQKIGSTSMRHRLLHLQNNNIFVSIWVERKNNFEWKALSSSNLVMSYLAGIYRRMMTHYLSWILIQPRGLDVNKRTVTMHPYSLLKRDKFGHYTISHLFSFSFLATSWHILKYAIIECKLSRYVSLVNNSYSPLVQLSLRRPFP